MLIVVITVSDFRSIISRIYANLAPGGVAELQDHTLHYFGEDDSAEEFFQASALARWFRYSKAGAAKRGKDIHNVANLKRLMIDAGFTDVVEEKVLVPM